MKKLTSMGEWEKIWEMGNIDSLSGGCKEGPGGWGVCYTNRSH